ncbi:MAG: class I SAM-dependent methyltransferase [Anaerolineae bacterium]|nr:class I SAM-dependent methyltransferase [Anaerolineae bacterium]
MKEVACNLCGANDARVRFPSTLPVDQSPEAWLAYRCTNSGYGVHSTIVQCRRCGFIYTNPQLEETAILETYTAVEDPLYIEEREGRVLTFENHLIPLEQLTGPPKGRALLDVGAYVGVFVEIAARHGWEAWGVEPSRWAVEQARARGLRVIPGTTATAELPPAYFDVVTMWDVIEHLADPMAELRQVWELVKPGGLVVIHTMDIDSVTARLMGERWPFLMEMHIVYFSRQTLRTMVEKAGFEVVKAHTQGRYLRLGYLAGRLAALWPPVGRLVEWGVNRLQLQGKTVAVNTLDLFTMYAQKTAR